MGLASLPPDVSRFLSAHITSIEQLEILGFLLRYRSQEWSPEAIAARFRTSAASVMKRLTPPLNEAGVVLLSTDPPCYQYRPSSPALHQVVQVVLRAHEVQPVEVIAEICARPNVKNWPRRKL